MYLNETLAFVTVVRTGSFTGAGRLMGVPKSTLSRQVSRLEERIGTRLLQRTTRRLSLTETGEAYYQRCRGAIEEIEEAERIAHDISGHARGRLKVSAPVDLSRDRIAPMLPEFRARYPEIELVFVLTQERVDLIAEGFDVALRGGLLPDAGFVSRKLSGSDMLVCASPSYLELRGRPTEIEQLREHDCVVMASGKGEPLNRLQGPEGVAVMPWQPWLVANEWGFLLTTLLDGLGVGPMLCTMADEHIAAGRLEQVLPEYGFRGGGLYAIYPSRHHLSPKVRVFVDFLVEKSDEAF